MKFLEISNRRTEFTRICIAEAIIALLNEKRIEEIRISNVVLKAGVSRMTFYNNFHSIEDVLKDYLHIIIARYINACNENEDIGIFQEYNHILFSLNFFDEYRQFFIIMKENGLHNILLNAINEFLVNINIDKDKEYEMHFYAGGLLNIFLKWESEEKRKKAEEIASIISHFLSKY